MDVRSVVVLCVLCVSVVKKFCGLCGFFEGKDNSLQGSNLMSGVSKGLTELAAEVHELAKRLGELGDCL